MQLQHSTLAHTAVHDVLITALGDPLLLGADDLAALVGEEGGAAGFEFAVAVVGCCGWLEGGAPGGDGIGGIVGGGEVGA